MRAKQIISAVLVLALLSFSGCSTIPQPTKEELLAEVNAEHKAVKKGTVDLSNYVKETDNKTLIEAHFENEISVKYNSEKHLTQQQAIEDVIYLFDAFHDCYGPYEYFGGAKVFDAAEEKIKQELQTKETLTAAELERILLENLTFIQDGHFSVNKKAAYTIKIPFFFREVAFIKTKDGYQTTDGKKVESVEGYKNLDELMKRSVSSKGELVYYPVLLKDNKPSTRLNFPQNCNEILTIHYTGGITQKLVAEPYHVYSEFFLKTPSEYQLTDYRQDGEIPVFQFNEFDLKHIEEIREGAKILGEAPISILDLRSNSGGSGLVAEDWIKTYAGTQISMNRSIIDTINGEFLLDGKDSWVNNSRILVILSGKYSASAAEMLIDYAHNLENVLIIGENTMGSMLGGEGFIELPYSAIKVGVGNNLLFLQGEGEENYFEELRGFYPDIWVPAGEAEEAAINLINNMIK